MLPTSAGVEPATSWSPVGRRIQLSHRGQLRGVLFTVTDWGYFVREEEDFVHCYRLGGFSAGGGVGWGGGGGKAGLVWGIFSSYQQPQIILMRSQGSQVFLGKYGNNKKKFLLNSNLSCAQNLYQMLTNEVFINNL